VFEPQDGWLAWLFRIVIACIAMAAVVIWLNPGAAQWSQWPLSERLLNLTMIIVSGLFAYLALLWLQGLRPSQLKKST
jgi:putative peptidoglycan lipid II flippase